MLAQGQHGPVRPRGCFGQYRGNGVTFEIPLQRPGPAWRPDKLRRECKRESVVHHKTTRMVRPRGANRWHSRRDFSEPQLWLESPAASSSGLGWLKENLRLAAPPAFAP